MTIMDRYILRNFLRTLILWFICFVGIYVVFDVLTKLDGFSKSEGGIVGMCSNIGKYYMIQTLPFFDKTAPLLSLISAMITIAMMNRYNELVPLFAAGISQQRVIRSIIFVVFLLTVVSAVNRETLIPKYMNAFQEEPADFLSASGSKMNAATDYRSCIRIQGNEVFFKEKRIHAPSVSLMDPSLSVFGDSLIAEDAVFSPKESDRPAGFMMKNVRKPTELLSQPSLCLSTDPKQPIVLTPKDHFWIAPTDCFIVSDVPFEYLASVDSWREYASTWNLISAVRDQSLDIGSDIETKIHTRIVQPFLDFTLLFLGLPIILQRGDRNVFKAMGIVALIVFVFLLIQYTALFLGRSMGTPVLGVWFPLLLFVPYAAHQYHTMNG